MSHLFSLILILFSLTVIIGSTQQIYAYEENTDHIIYAEYFTYPESEIDEWDYSVMFSYYDIILRQTPDNSIALTFKGHALGLNEEYSKALTYYTTAIIIDPDNVSAILNKGISLNALGSYDKAITQFDIILDIYANNKFKLIKRGMSTNDIELYNLIATNEKDYSLKKLGIEESKEYLDEGMAFEILETGTNNTITYSYNIPFYADIEIVKPAIDNAFNSWMELNPQLDYVFTNATNSNIIIEFQKLMTDDILGFVNSTDSTINDDMSALACYNNCLVSITLDAYDYCQDRWSYITKDSLQNTMTHEIGHTLGLVHINNESHIMYTGADESGYLYLFDDLGYDIPLKIKNEVITISQQESLENMDNTHDKIEKILNTFGLTWDNYFWDNYTSHDPNFDNKINPKIDEYRTLINDNFCYAWDMDKDHLLIMVEFLGWDLFYN